MMIGSVTEHAQLYSPQMHMRDSTVDISLKGRGKGIYLWKVEGRGYISGR